MFLSAQVRVRTNVQLRHMGYHVRLDEASSDLIRTLAREPGEVFGRLYSAYLLFLVTQHDKLPATARAAFGTPP
jgi:hypothetical protein